MVCPPASTRLTALAVLGLAIGCGGSGQPTGRHGDAGTCVTSGDCGEGEACLQGRCIDQEIDEDGDGYASATDCDDSDAEVGLRAERPCRTGDCLDATERCESGRWSSCSCGPRMDASSPVEGGAGRDASPTGDGSALDDAGVPGEGEQAGSCDDGADNDGDGVADCADPGCASAGACECVPTQGAELSCGNGADDDCDGFADCADPDCNGEGCGSGLSCQDGTCVACGECMPGATEQEDCGNCGTRSRTCSQWCTWGGWGECTDQGECTPGATTNAGCDNDCQVRTCTASCRWPDQCTGCRCSGMSQCGGSCPEDYHRRSHGCSSSCGSCLNATSNMVRCEPNCGSSFVACGGSCPDGYHSVSYGCSSSCGSCQNVTSNNVSCSMNAPVP